MKLVAEHVIEMLPVFTLDSPFLRQIIVSEDNSEPADTIRLKIV